MFVKLENLNKQTLSMMSSLMNTIPDLEVATQSLLMNLPVLVHTLALIGIMIVKMMTMISVTLTGFYKLKGKRLLEKRKLMLPMKCCKTN